MNDPRVAELVRTHLLSSRAETAPGNAHALDLDGLQSADISFWTIWDADMLLGMGALKRLSADHGEVKSMHTVQSVRRRGVGSAMLRHIIASARAGGMSRLSLDPVPGTTFNLHAPCTKATASWSLRRLAIMFQTQIAFLCRSTCKK